jgi:hypothetical protein
METIVTILPDKLTSSQADVFLIRVCSCWPTPWEVRRAFRAWPLAWPSPSGPLGRQRLRRSRVGPGDPFCEAVRKDLGVPLTLEGPTWTIRGVPARWL